MAAAIILHKFGLVPEEDDHQVFTFIFDNPKKLLDSKSVESTEVSYGGHIWSIVCMHKEERYVGIFLKWKYTDGPSASLVSCKAKYDLTLIHRHDYTQNKVFRSTQKFSSAQSLLGKSKFVAMDSLLNLSEGFLDDTGKRMVLELSITRCSTRFDKTIDMSPTARTRKNASGYYFDTSTFALANQKWYLRVYPEKANANGLPAVYLYLATKSLGTSIEMNFLLYVGEDCTEILNYNFGEGAKFDGFGKTLPEPLYNVKKMAQLTVGAEINTAVVYKLAAARLRPTGVYAPRVYKDYNTAVGGRSGGYRNNYTGSSLTAAEAFQDQDGNYWKIELSKEYKKMTLVFDKGVHHFPHNKTKLLCWSATLLSRDPERARDLDMESEPLVGYFSNFIDDKGYLMSFPIEVTELENRDNSYADEQGEMLLRINILSLQTIPIGMRAIPRFDFQVKHLIRARQQLQEHIKNLEDMREMTASRASLSFLDTPNSREDRLHSENTSTSSGIQEKSPLYKSYDSLDALSTGDMMVSDDDYGRHFYCDILRHLANKGSEPDENKASASDYVSSGRDSFHGTREDLSTESGVTVSDESSLLLEARPSPVDMGKQKELVSVLVKFLNQRLPLRITEVLEAGSLGTGTGTRSRMDVDLILFSPDLPNKNQAAWMPFFLKAIHNFLMNASCNPDPFYPLPKCTEFSVTPYTVQFNCGGLDVDVMLCCDWDTEEGGGYVALYGNSLKQTTARARQWCALASSRLRKKFVFDQPNEVKEIIKVVKHWRNCVHWKKKEYRPDSYLLSLLVIRAVEQTRSFDMKRILQQLGGFVMEPELSLTWSIYYIPEKYQVEFDPPTPLIRDPANPGVNVAESLSYWGQFRSEIVTWLRSLGLTYNVDGLGTVAS